MNTRSTSDCLRALGWNIRTARSDLSGSAGWVIETLVALVFSLNVADPAFVAFGGITLRAMVFDVAAFLHSPPGPPAKKKSPPPRDFRPARWVQTGCKSAGCENSRQSLRRKRRVDRALLRILVKSGTVVTGAEGHGTKKNQLYAATTANAHSGWRVRRLKAGCLQLFKG